MSAQSQGVRRGFWRFQVSQLSPRLPFEPTVPNVSVNLQLPHCHCVRQSPQSLQLTLCESAAGPTGGN